MGCVCSEVCFNGVVTRVGSLFGGERYVEIRSESGNTVETFPVFNEAYLVGDRVLVSRLVIEDGCSELRTVIRKQPDLAKPIE